MASFNKVMLMGNLTRDPELRYTSSGQAVCNFSLAINRYFNDKQGERKEETTFMRITVWGKQGENCAQYLPKADLLLWKVDFSPEAGKLKTVRKGQQSM